MIAVCLFIGAVFFVFAAVAKVCDHLDAQDPAARFASERAALAAASRRREVR